MRVQITTNEGIPVGTITETFDVEFTGDYDLADSERDRIRGVVRTATTGDRSTTPDAVQGDSVTPPERPEPYPPEIGLHRAAWALADAGPYQGTVVGDVAKAEHDATDRTLEIRDTYRIWLADPDESDVPADVSVRHDPDGGPDGTEYFYEVPFQTTTSVEIGKQDPSEWRPEDRATGPDYDDLVACGVPAPDLELTKLTADESAPRPGLYKRAASPLTLLYLYKQWAQRDAPLHCRLIKRELDRRGVVGVERVAAPETTVKEWVQDPSPDTQHMRWRNTETGEYRYQEHKPGSRSAEAEQDAGDDDPAADTGDGPPPEIVAIAEEIGNRVDWTDVDESRSGEPELATEQKQVLRDTLAEHFDEDAVRTYHDAIWDWKQDSIGGLASAHGHAFKEALGIESPARDDADPTDQHVQIAQVMNYVSEQIFEAEFGESRTFHRGMSDTGARNLLTTWLEQPDADEYELDMMALNNFTPQRDTANYFGEYTATITTEASADQIGLLTDYLTLTDNTDEGEVHLKGDGLRVTRNEIEIGGEVSLGEFPDGWDDDNHRLFYDRLAWFHRSIHDEDEFDVSDEALTTLAEWGKHVRDETDLYDEHAPIREYVDQILDAYHAIDPDQTQLDDFKAAPVINLRTEDELRMGSAAAERFVPSEVADDTDAAE